MKEEPIIIDAETARMIALNREMNPRETVYGEATNTINPITGRPYEDQYIVIGEFSEKLMSSFSYLNLKKDSGFKKISYIGDFPKPTPKSPLRTKTIELQKALGRIDVREGKIDVRDYLIFSSGVEALSRQYRETPGFTLDSITTVQGLNSALRGITFSEPLLRKEDYFSFKESTQDRLGLPRIHHEDIFCEDSN